MKQEIILGDALIELRKLPSESIDCCITSPPYWGLRDYGVLGQLGLEKTPEEYVAKMVDVFGEVKRVLKKEGTFWLNLGDSYANQKEGNTQGISTSGLHYTNPNKDLKEFRDEQNFKKTIPMGLKQKDLVGIPWRVAFALQKDGWYLRQDIIWHKPNPMPESVTDRCTKAHEYIFLLSKSQKYYFDANAIKETSTTFENRPAGVVRNREYGYNSKENNNPEAYMKNIKGSISIRGITRTTEGLNLKTQAEKTKEYRNRRSVWTVTTKPFKGAHFASFPEDLILPCVLAGCLKGGTILDPFAGVGTTGVVAKKNNRNFIGIELNPKYIIMGQQRINNTMENLL